MSEKLRELRHPLRIGGRVGRRRRPRGHDQERPFAGRLRGAARQPQLRRGRALAAEEGRERRRLLRQRLRPGPERQAHRARIVAGDPVGLHLEPGQPVQDPVVALDQAGQVGAAQHGPVEVSFLVGLGTVFQMERPRLAAAAGHSGGLDGQRAAGRDAVAEPGDEAGQPVRPPVLAPDVGDHEAVPLRGLAPEGLDLRRGGELLFDLLDAAPGLVQGGSFGEPRPYVEIAAGRFEVRRLGKQRRAEQGGGHVGGRGGGEDDGAGVAESALTPPDPPLPVRPSPPPRARGE